jgi:hypothetical protein
VSSMEMDQGNEDVESVDPDEVDSAPPGSADEEGGGGGAGDLGSETGAGESVGTGWTEGGGMPPEGEGQH